MSNVLTRSLFIFLFALPFFTSATGVLYAFLTLSLYLAISGIVLLQSIPKKSS
jgi:uncharacterized membrane protein